MKILIVEDELPSLIDIQLVISDLGYKDILVAKSLADANNLISLYTVDFVFLDIRLNRTNEGIGIANILNTLDIPFAVTSQYNQCFLYEQIKKFNPLGYLIKPIQPITARYLLDRASTIDNGVNSNIKPFSISKHSIFIKERASYIKIKLVDILYLKSDGNYVFVYTHIARHVLRIALIDLIERLDSSFFYRIHRSYAVNIIHVTKYSHNDLTIMAGTDTIPVGKKYRTFIKKLMRF